MRNFLYSAKGFFPVFLISIVISLIPTKPIYLWMVVLSFLLTILFVPISEDIAKFFRVLDIPSERKLHKDPKPLLGGLAIFLGFSATMFLTRESLPPRYSSLLIAGFLMMLIGLVDDARGLPVRMRFLTQFFLAAWVISLGFKMEIFPIREPWGKFLNEFFSVIWIVGFANAYNFIDGIDGLAAGVGIIILLSLSLISALNGYPAPLFFSIPISGALLGFLLFNFYPARIFLGDAGAQFLGFTISALSVDAAWANPGEPLRAIISPLLVMWLLFFDMIMTTILRVKHKKVKSVTEWLEYAGKDHVHHRLLKMGFSVREASSVLWLLSALFAGLSLLVNRSGIAVQILIFSVVVGLTFAATYIFDKTTSID